jgi:hypothetical protein
MSGASQYVKSRQANAFRRIFPLFSLASSRRLVCVERHSLQGCAEAEGFLPSVSIAKLRKNAAIGSMSLTSGRM